MAAASVAIVVAPGATVAATADPAAAAEHPTRAKKDRRRPDQG
jgi:hypothetical protein